MKSTKTFSTAVRWLAGVAVAMSMSSAAIAAIATTKHNLGTSGTGTNRVTTGTAEICVFCHTPHAADVSTVGVPLWNKRLNTGVGTFTTYASSTMNAIGANDGQGGGQIGSVSLACLSCHDGTQAMDNMLNAPGSGGYSATGGGTTGQPIASYTWNAAAITAGTVNADGQMTNAATTLAMLGKDLNNDHPIGIQYCGGGPRVGTTGAACSDGDFTAPTTAVLGGTDVFWVNSNAAAGRQKDDLYLYNRSFAANGTLPAGTYPSVECASCHDVHGGVTGTTFLRISNAGSAVCLACHTK
jgi:predicted CXXCH cytochrome family protein